MAGFNGRDAVCPELEDNFAFQNFQDLHFHEPFSSGNIINSNNLNEIQHHPHNLDQVGHQLNSLQNQPRGEGSYLSHQFHQQNPPPSSSSEPSLETSTFTPHDLPFPIENDFLWAEPEDIFNHHNFEYLPSESLASGNIINSNNLNEIQHHPHNLDQVGHQLNSLQNQPIGEGPNFSHQFHQQNPPPSSSAQPSLETSTLTPHDLPLHLSPNIISNHLGEASGPSAQPSLETSTFTPHDLPLHLSPNIISNHLGEASGPSASSILEALRKSKKKLGSKRKSDRTSQATRRVKVKLPRKTKDTETNIIHWDLVDYNPSTYYDPLVLKAVQLYLGKYEINADPITKMIYLFSSEHSDITKNLKLFLRSISPRDPETNSPLKPAKAKRNDSTLSTQELWSQFDIGRKRFADTIIYLPEITQYIDGACCYAHDNNESVAQAIDKVHPKNGRIAHLKMDGLHMSNRVFPLYLFLSDIISTIIPVGHLDDEGKFLREERRKARDSFYDAVKKALLFDSKKELEDIDGAIDKSEMRDLVYLRPGNDPEHVGRVDFTESLRSRIIDKPNTSAANIMACVWELLHFWMSSHRGDLLVKPTNSFKGSVRTFINDIAVCLVDGVVEKKKRKKEKNSSLNKKSKP